RRRSCPRGGSAPAAGCAAAERRGRPARSWRLQDRSLKPRPSEPITPAVDRGLYIAASGMMAEQIRQDQIANDLANAATPGYKADRTAQREFGDLLLANRASGQVVGRQSTAVQVDEIRTDFTPQPARDTGEPLDFAIVGEGFFGVRTADGVRYTRNGQFTVSPQGLLVTASGDPVLARGGRTARVAADGRVDPRSLEVVRLD